MYVYLLKMYLQPPPASTLGFSASQGVTPKTDVKAALKLMKEHAPKIDTSKVGNYDNLLFCQIDKE